MSLCELREGRIAHKVWMYWIEPSGGTKEYKTIQEYGVMDVQ